MRRSWNVLLWAGFAVGLVAAISYFLIFARYPVTRDMPWVNLLLFGVAGGMLALGLHRAFTKPQQYRGRTTGVVFSLLTLSIFGLFCWGNFILARRIPSSTGAPRIGQHAPDFILADANGKPVALRELLKQNRAVLLVFYRGYW